MADFQEEREAQIDSLLRADGFRKRSRQWLEESCGYSYSYHFDWMGLPIIQYPQDVVAMQEIIWRTRPDLIVETGIARGGSLVFYASMLKLLGGRGRVVGIDIDIREPNRLAIEAHPMASWITMLEGSSIDPGIVSQVTRIAADASGTLVILDSLHTHEHVLAELEAYAPLVTEGSYLVVFDTVIEDMAADAFIDRPWSKERNPKTAVREFLASNNRFRVDEKIESKLQITVAPEGYLRCVGES